MNQQLFDYMYDEYDIMLLDSDYQNIKRIIMFEIEAKPEATDDQIETIINAVAAAYKIEPERLKIKRRLREVTEPRQLIFTLLKFGLRLTSQKIGILMGNFNHATVLHGINQMSSLYTSSKSYRVLVMSILSDLFTPDEIVYILERIKNPHLDRMESLSKHVFA